MRSWWWCLLVVVLLVGCGQVKACGRSTPATGSSTPAPSGTTEVPPPPAAEPSEARFAGQYLVIVHASPTPGEGEPIVEKLRTAGLGAEVWRLSSTPFAALRPCLEVVVAGAFSRKEEALALAGRLSELGVENYLKHAGVLAKDRERREATCRQQEAARAVVASAGGSGPRFVELRGPRTFVLLSHEPRATPGAVLRPVSGDRGFWLAPLGEDPTGALQEGSAFDLYDGKGALKTGCRVKGFASINRGIPHFSYFQRPEEPQTPGCGSPWPVAELDCSLAGTRAMEEHAVVFALPGGSPAPRYFARADALPEPVKANQEAALRALPAFEKTRAEGAAHAQEQGMPLKESLELRVFPASERQVVVGLVRFHTGDGSASCGGPDFSATVSRVVAVGERGQETPVGGGLDGERILAVMDLEGDGRVELLTRDPVDPTRVALVREDGAPLAASFVPNCDCGC